MDKYITPELLQIIITAIVLPLLSVAVKNIITYIKLKNTEMQAKINENLLDKYLQIAESSVLTAVNSVSQSYVEQLKKENNFSSESHTIALEKAKSVALQIMGETTKKVVTEIHGDVDKYIENKIEQLILKSK